MKMCAVAGFYSTKIRLSKRVISEMLNCLRHRGPDNVGIYAFDNNDSGLCHAALGHARLHLVGSIETGRQPLTSGGGTCVVSINGEIYNSISLWKTYFPDIAIEEDWSDCQIVADLYEKMGMESLSLLEGLYAGVIFDIAKNRMIIFRDHFGTKPLYYAYSKGAVFICSEIRPIFAATYIKPNCCKQALLDFLHYQTPMNERTLFSDIYCVAPGTSIVFSGDIATRSVIPSPWRDSPVVYQDFSPALVARELKDRFFAVMERQWHQGAGSFLSGGIDSNSIVATLVRQRHILPTYTARFPTNGLLEFDRDSNEYLISAQLALGYKVPHKAVDICSKDLREVLPMMVSFLEDLRGPMSLGAWRVAQEAASECKVLFSGMGADEIFGGYVDRIHLFADTSLNGFEAFEKLWSRKMIARDEAHIAFRSEFARDYSGYRLKDALTGSLLPLLDNNSPDAVSNCAALRFDQTFFLPALLHVEDRMCMAHGIESRVPFLDPIVIRLLPKIPSGFFIKTTMGKELLRKAMEGVIPESVVERKKQPFRVPESSWYSRDLNIWMRKKLLNKDSFILEVFNYEWLSDLIIQQGAGQTNRRNLLWSLLCLDEWAKIFIQSR